MALLPLSGGQWRHLERDPDRPAREFPQDLRRGHRQIQALRPTHSVTRCETCGTPLPAEDDASHAYLSPGILADVIGVRIESHIFIGSRADRDHDMEEPRHFDERSS